MNKVRHILRLHTQGYKKLQIAEQTGVARNTLKKYISEFIKSGLSYSEINELTDKDLEDLFVKPLERLPVNEKLKTLFEYFPIVDKELKRKGTTRRILWQAYKQINPEGVGRSQFNRYYAAWKAQVNPSMHMEHKVGDKIYVYFAGEKLHIIDKQTG